MKQIYNSDKPIFAKGQDRFNRNKFSNRIAETITKRNDNDGLVIGLYGVWGEGKSSVLNMIEEELNTNNEVLIVKFNPWRFKDEDTLILNFLKNISDVLNRELNTKTEKFGDFLKKYGSVTSIFNFDLSKLGENFSDIQLEDLKNRVNDFLKESDKKIVVIIDDIDRLDKQELFSLFKLIKLTGDFSKTYYILSFDDEMVASAIGERFAEGNINSGHNFLEKIIQVPLRIPQALSNDLLNYTFELLNNILSENKIELGTNEEQNVGYLISQNILLKIKTPRLAIRFSNSLSFLIPLLKGEVNISDLILFEGVKVFYPKYYEFIKNSPEYFIESYNEPFSNNKDNSKIEEFNVKIEKLNSNLTKYEKAAILNLLKKLFPYVREATENYSLKNIEQDWTKEKRIVSLKYFYKYFIYSVPKDEISDVYFDNYINSLNSKKIDELISQTNEILENVNPVEYLNKVRFYEDNLDWNSIQIISKIICHFENKFEGMKGGTFMFGYNNPKSQAAITICRILIKHTNYLEKLEFSKYLMSSEIPFEFSEEISNWLSVGNKEEEEVIKKDDMHLLNNILLERALSDCTENKTNIFEKYEKNIFSLLEIWFQKNEQELNDYIDKLIIFNPKIVSKIIYALTSTVYSSSKPYPYKIDFTKDNFELLKKYYNIKKFIKVVNDEYSGELEKEEVIFFNKYEGQNIINSLRQFVHWYKSENK